MLSLLEGWKDRSPPLQFLIFNQRTGNVREPHVYLKIGEFNNVLHVDSGGTVHFFVILSQTSPFCKGVVLHLKKRKIGAQYQISAIG